MEQPLATMALARVGKCCRSLLLESSKFCGSVQPAWIESCIGAKRHLLPEDVVKLQKFQQSKLAVAHLLNGTKGNFIEFFSQKLQRNELILRDELKLLIHLCQTAEDVMVARDAIYRYHAENHNLMYGEFKFGPLFMRLCYELGLEGLAAATITDMRLNGFFHDATSFNIAIDMLFTKGQYETALEVLRIMKSQNVPFNKDTLTLAFGICYKLNTAESYKICLAFVEERQSKEHVIPKRAYCFAIALSLCQNDIAKAQLMFSQIMSTECRLCQNLKVVILAKSGAIMDAVSVLAAAVLPKSPYFVKKLEFSQEVVDLLRLQSEGQPSMLNVEKIVTQLVRADQVTQQTLDDMLCHTPTGKETPIMQRKTSRRTLKPLHSTLLSE
ncbi:pentatricopeptide repeat-containing protein 2, mitochondrial isoform X1 [Takifugu rubripes]|uniref:Pentatricopeptide repeat-containing protein 2, mitochondrial n=1 Tax=Takifugu rubripes TaxID=31033 RepID=H2VD74_TAKRU|nr:pentatricopeptide repeat-containing protein 2, mitochondrial isoform X1 [Takifugu rubripes]|eukprot:XP_003965348.2 PREDICTED: pentatricopeptide repeat-containing protein 2, mitochondrial isoform X1 [Takifugu rubripes]